MVVVMMMIAATTTTTTHLPLFSFKMCFGDDDDLLEFHRLPRLHLENVTLRLHCLQSAQKLLRYIQGFARSL